MSFIADKKREHETAAVKALEEKDYSKAFFHTVKAAEFGLALAEQSEGTIAQRYVEDAFELIEIASELKTKAQKQAPEAALKALMEAGGGADTGNTQWILKEKPTEKLDDVAGLADVKQELRDKVIAPFLHPKDWKKFKLRKGGGILMYGPPGNGKTYIAKAIAGELDAAFINVNPYQIKDKYVGETEKNLQRLFDEARSHERCVLFLDEVDHLLSRQGSQKTGTVKMFLSLTDGLVKNTTCLLVLAATNKPWMLDEAVIRPGRIGTRIYVGPPDKAAREALVALNMENVPLAEDVAFTEIAEQTEDFSGADITELCERAKLLAFNRQIAAKTNELVANNDFREALEKVRPSVTLEMIDKYLQWRGGRAMPPEAGDDD